MWLATAALLPVSILYLHGWGAAAPVYFLGVGFTLVALAVRTVVGGGSFRPPRSYFVLWALMCYLAASDCLRGETVSPNTGNLVLGVLAPLLAFSCDFRRPHVKALRAGAWAAIALIALDRAIQFTPYALPFFEEEVSPEVVDWYYQYKASYLAGDSNSIALFLLPLFGLLLFTSERRGRLGSALEVCLQLATFSKAGVAAVAVRDALGAALKASWLTKAVLAGSVALVGAAAATTQLDLDQSLASGRIKLDTFRLFLEELRHADLPALIWGAGNNTAEARLGIYLHAWPMTAIYESGLVGFALVVLYLVFSYQESPRIFRLLHLPVFLVAGLSFLFYLGSMWLYLPQYLLLGLERHGHPDDPAHPSYATAFLDRGDTAP